MTQPDSVLLRLPAQAVGTAKQWLWALLGFAAIVIVIVAVSLVASPSLDALNVPCRSADGYQPWFNDLRALLMPLGKNEAQVLLIGALGAFGLRRRATAALVALVLVGVCVSVIKPTVNRVRPDGSAHSFPSGDAASSAAIATVLTARTAAVVTITVPVVAGVGLFRVLDERHYPSDVAAGIALGVAAGFLGTRWTRRRRYPSARPFLALAVVAAGSSTWGLFTGGSSRYATELAVLLPPLLALVTARILVVMARRGALPNGWVGGRGVAAVALLGLTVYWFMATGSTLWDRDEPRFARCAVEMVESGDYLVPTFNGELRPDKPAGIYWLMSVPLRLFGVSEWAVRAWSGIGVLLAAVFAAWLAWRHLGMRWPVLVAAIVLVTPLTLVVGTAATADGALLACVTGAIALYGQTLWNGWRWWTAFALGVVLGAALLIKGPVGLAVPVLTAVTAQVMVRRRLGTPLARSLAALAVASAIGLALFAAWGLPANAATGGELARVGLGHHVVERALTPLESHGGQLLLHLPYYLLVVVFLFVPWTLFLPAAVSAVLRGSVVDERGAGALDRVVRAHVRVDDSGGHQAAALHPAGLPGAGDRRCPDRSGGP